MKINSTLFIIILACFTLGLAPYTPEPHLYGKLRWVLGGANGMTLLDWGDLLLHSSPWIILILYLVKKGKG